MSLEQTLKAIYESRDHRVEKIRTPSYTSRVFYPQALQVIVTDLAKRVEEEQVDAIAGCGFSGIPVVAAVSFYTRIPMILVRKPSETEHKFHSGTAVQGYIGDGKYIIIDDTVATGATVRRIVNEITEFNPRLICKGVITFAEGGDNEDSYPVSLNSNSVEWITGVGYRPTDGSNLVTVTSLYGRK